MTSRLLTKLSIWFIASAALAGGSNALCQINSTSATVSLTATLGETLTLSATPANLTFTLAAGTAATGSAPIAITTSWVLKTNRSAVNLYAWFTTPSAALTDGAATPNNIPSSDVFGQMTTGTPASYTAFTQTNALGTASGGLALFSQSITSTNRAGTRSDNLNLKIDLTNEAQLPAGTYNGTLTLQAQSL